MSQMTKQEAIDALATVLVDGITPDDISFTEEEHTQAVLAWNYFRKEGTSERARWVAAVEGMMHECMADERLTGRDQDAIVHLLQTLLTRMEAS